MNVLLKKLAWANGSKENRGDVRIASGKIAQIGRGLQSLKNEPAIDFDGHYIYPGLINAHDHLEMNLYPRLGHPPYEDYIAWANDIYRPSESPVLEIEKVHLRDRLMVGALKNLLSGVSTVVHHNPYYFNFRFGYPVWVLKRYAWAHSLSSDKGLVSKFNQNCGKPFIVHGAEGTNPQAIGEIDELCRLGVLGPNTVLVHGVGINDQNTNIFVRSGTSLVWCPSSNYFLFGKTAPIADLKGRVRIALGTDSTLTGEATLFDEMKKAYSTGMVSAEEIFCMVTNIPASMFGINRRVRIEEGAEADILILPARKKDYYENILNATPIDIQWLMIRGKLKVAALERNVPLHNKMHRFKKLMIDIDIDHLKRRISQRVPKQILEQNPLWNLTTNGI